MKLFRALALASLLTLAFVGRHANGQASLMPMPAPQYTDSNGVPLAGGFIYTCVAGASCPGTPLASYTDSTGSVANTNPVVLNAAGRGQIWLAASNYKIVAQDLNNVTQWTVDNVSAVSLGQLSGNSVFSSVTVTGNATIGGNLTLSGTFTGATANITGSETVGGAFSAQSAAIAANVTIGGALDVTGPITGSLVGDVTGNLTGNASTANALAAVPTQCASGHYATGIAASGNANCTVLPVVALQSVEQIGTCATGTSSHATCVTSVTWPVSYTGTGYRAVCSLIGPTVGDPVIRGVTKYSDHVDVTLRNGTADGAVASSGAAIDCIAHN